MKHYLTDYEKELLKHINDLNGHIKERDAHLVKANGYAPYKPMDAPAKSDSRTEFGMKIISEKLFHEKFEFERPKRHPIGFPVGLFIVKKKMQRLDRFKYDATIFISIDDLRKLRSVSTGVISGRINDEGRIALDVLPKILFPAELFTDIAPAYPPELRF
jgi:hypothetical protein